MKKSKLLWIGPVIESQLFESISLFYEEVHLLGQPSYVLTALSEESASKLVLENSILESGGEERYFESHVLESVSYFDDVAFSGKKVPLLPINVENRICIDKFLSNLMEDSDSSYDIVLANQLMPQRFFEKVIKKLDLLKCEGLYFIRDSRIKSEFTVDGEALCYLLEENSFSNKKIIYFGKYEVSEYRLSYFNEKKALELKIYNLEQQLANRERKEIEVKQLEAEQAKSISILENEKANLLIENEKLATEIISLKKSLDTIARENHHILIKLSEE